jgi:hypothetical protein
MRGCRKEKEKQRDDQRSISVPVENEICACFIGFWILSGGFDGRVEGSSAGSTVFGMADGRE